MNIYTKAMLLHFFLTLNDHISLNHALLQLYLDYVSCLEKNLKVLVMHLVSTLRN